LNNLINIILPVESVKHYILSVFATGLTGVQIENIFIYTGDGGNGKSLLNLLFLDTLGNQYGYNLPSIILQSALKTGANPELANLHKKRYVVAQEPDHNKKICMSAVKEITGGKKINARALYSSKMDVLLCLSLCIECNQKPLLDEVLDAVIRRLRVVPFITKSVEQAEYDALPEDERVNVNVKNTYYKSIEFQEKFKQAFFEILKPYAKAFYENNCELPDVPAECAKENRDYLAVSDDLFSWFNDVFEPLQKEELGGNTDKPIPLTDIYKSFSNGEFYLSLPKIEKRKYNRKGFLETFEKNIFLRKAIKRRNARYNNKQVSSDCIVGWKLRTDDAFNVEVEEEFVYEEV
jgi:phage/plasmid-associated DNA primase